MRLVGDALARQRSRGHREGDHAHRAVVRGQRRRVGLHQAQRAQRRIQHEGDREAQRHAGQHLRRQRGHRLPRQLQPALQADGQQQVDRQRLVQRLGQPQVALDQAREHAEQEEEDDDVDHGPRMLPWLAPAARGPGWPSGTLPMAALGLPGTIGLTT
jgi:hypothetical protein